MSDPKKKEHIFTRVQAGTYATASANYHYR